MKVGKGLDLCCGEKERETGGGRLLLRWIVCEADALCDVALQAFYGGLEKSLFVFVEVVEWVVGLLCPRSLMHR
jgi:hypothetical protein